jgi:hypothetical protein
MGALGDNGGAGRPDLGEQMLKPTKAMKARMALWEGEPSINEASFFLTESALRGSTGTKADAVGVAAMGLSDGAARVAIFGALAQGSDKVGAHRMGGAALHHAKDPAAFLDACSIFKLDPSAPFWLALAALDKNAAMVDFLLAQGVAPEDKNGAPALVFASFDGVECFDGTMNRIHWSAQDCEGLVSSLSAPKQIALLSPQARVTALDALASNIEAAAFECQTGAYDLALSSVPSSCEALVKLWDSLPVEQALQARRAARVLFGVALGVAPLLHRFGTSDKLKDTPGSTGLSRLANAQDWPAAEALCQKKDWTLGSVALGVFSTHIGISCARGSHVGFAPAQRALHELFDKYESLCAAPINQAKGILRNPSADDAEYWRMSSPKEAGVALHDWMVKKERLLPVSEIGAALGSYAVILRKAKGSSSDLEALLPNFSREMHAIFQVAPELDSVKKLLNDLANEWGVAEQPVNAGDMRSFLDSWADKFDICAVSVGAVERPEPKQPAPKRRL